MSKRGVDVGLERHLFIAMLMGIEEPRSIIPSSLLKALFSSSVLSPQVLNECLGASPEGPSPVGMNGGGG